MTDLDTPARSERSPVSMRPAIAVLLVVLGLGFCLLWKVASGTERHSYDSGAAAPEFVTLVGGRGYTISVHGGVPTELARGVSPDALTCAISGVGVATVKLTLTDEVAGTKAVNQIASFVAPVSGQVAITCDGLGAVFVDDSADAGFDYAGLLLWLGVAALVVGVPLGLSELRLASAHAPGVLRGSSDDDQVE